MKKLRRFKKRSSSHEQPSRITNETVAEHRERILAGGRRFKYPVQYARHRLVINTIVISVIALISVVLFAWWQLYPQQNTSTFFYRITKVFPLPVAAIDGERVPYSDYLSAFRSQEHYLQVKEGVELYSKDNKQQLDYIKREALNDAIADSYARKLAKDNNITVSSEQIDEAMKRQRESRDGVASQETYDAIVLDHFNWTPEEARTVTAHKLLRQAVAYAIDDTATKQRDEVVEKLKTQTDFEKLAASIEAVGDARVQAGAAPLVPSSNQDGGLAAAASRLDVGKVSEPFRSTTGDGYYIVKLLEKNNDGRVSYAYLKIPLTKFDLQLEKVKNDKKVFQEYISVPQVNTSLRQ
jgi:hypothetical protein